MGYKVVDRAGSAEVWEFSWDDLARIAPPHNFCFVSTPEDVGRGLMRAVVAPARHYLGSTLCPSCMAEGAIPGFIAHPFLPPSPLPPSIMVSNVPIRLIITRVRSNPVHEMIWHVSCPFCGWNMPASSLPDTMFSDVKKASAWRHTADPGFVTEDQAVVYALLLRDGPQTAYQLSRRIHASHPRTTNILTSLINKGLVVRMSAPGRGRKEYLYRVTTDEEREKILRRPRRLSYYKAF